MTQHRIEIAVEDPAYCTKIWTDFCEWRKKVSEAAEKEGGLSSWPVLAYGCYSIDEYWDEVGSGPGSFLLSILPKIPACAEATAHLHDPGFTTENTTQLLAAWYQLNTGSANYHRDRANALTRLYDTIVFVQESPRMTAFKTKQPGVHKHSLHEMHPNSLEAFKRNGLIGQTGLAKVVIASLAKEQALTTETAGFVAALLDEAIARLKAKPYPMPKETPPRKRKASNTD